MYAQVIKYIYIHADHCLSMSNLWFGLGATDLYPVGFSHLVRIAGVVKPLGE